MLFIAVLNFDFIFLESNKEQPHLLTYFALFMYKGVYGVCKIPEL